MVMIDNEQKLKLTFEPEQVQISYTQCILLALIDNEQELKPKYLKIMKKIRD